MSGHLCAVMMGSPTSLSARHAVTRLKLFAKGLVLVRMVKAKVKGDCMEVMMIRREVKVVHKKVMVGITLELTVRLCLVHSKQSHKTDKHKTVYSEILISHVSAFYRLWVQNKAREELCLSIPL